MRHVHELGSHVDAARVSGLLPAHRAREEIRRVELLRDLLRRLGRLAVRSRARPRDDLQARQRGQLAADLVRDAVGEVVLVGWSLVLERQDGDPLDGARGGSGLDAPPRRRQTRIAAAPGPAPRRRGRGALLEPPRARATAGIAAPEKLCEEASDSANATSRADWNRFVAVLLEAVADDAVERGRDVAARGDRLRRLVAQDRRHRVARRVPPERPRAREQLVEDRAEGEQIGAVVHRDSADLLRRHVAHGAHHRAGLGKRSSEGRNSRFVAFRHGLLPRGRLLTSGRVERPPESQAEVEDLDVPVARDEQVVGLQVAVHDAALVSGGESLRDLERVVHGLLLRDRARVELPAQGLALQELHRRVRDAVLRSEVEDREDVRVRQRRHGLRLALEAGQRVGILREPFGKDLDGDVAVELRVAGAVDLAHAAGAERGKDLVGAESRAGGERHFAATSLWKLGFWRSESQVLSTASHAGVTEYGDLQHLLERGDRLFRLRRPARTSAPGRRPTRSRSTAICRPGRARSRDRPLPDRLVLPSGQGPASGRDSAGTEASLGELRPGPRREGRPSPAYCGPRPTLRPARRPRPGRSAQLASSSSNAAGVRRRRRAKSSGVEQPFGSCR